jgi:hypothetical protein
LRYRKNRRQNSLPVNQLWNTDDFSLGAAVLLVCECFVNRERMDQERPSPSASEVASVVPRWRSGSDIHQSTHDGALVFFAPLRLCVSFLSQSPLPEFAGTPDPRNPRNLLIVFSLARRYTGIPYPISRNRNPPCVNFS